MAQGDEAGTSGGGSFDRPTSRRRVLRTGAGAAAAFGLGSVTHAAVGDDSPGPLPLALGAPVDVRRRGALGDGRSDDTAAIQAVIDELIESSGGGTIFFPPGDYGVSTLKLHFKQQTPINLIGSGRRVTRLTKQGGGEEPILDISSGPSIVDLLSEVRDLSVLGPTGGAGHDGIRVADSARFTLRAVDVRNCRRGIQSIGSLLFKLDDCVLIGNEVGLELRSSDKLPATLIVADNCQFASNRRLGVDADRVSGLVLRGCDIEANGAPGDLETGGVRYRSGETFADTAWCAVYDSWFELNHGRAFRAEAGEVNLYSPFFLSNDEGRDVYVDGAARFNMFGGQAPSGGGGIVEIASARTSGVIFNSLVRTFVPGSSNVMKIDGGTIVNGGWSLSGSGAYSIRNGTQTAEIRRVDNGRLAISPFDESPGGAGTELQGRTLVQELRVGSMAAPAAPTETLFVDTTDNKLKYKDAAGTVNSLY